MLDALERHFPARRPGRARGRPVPVGDAADYIDTTDLLARALRENVAFVPGAAAFVDGGGSSSMRLNFSGSDRGGDPRGDPPDRRGRHRAGRLYETHHRRARRPRSARSGAAGARRGTGRPANVAAASRPGDEGRGAQGRAVARAAGLAASRRAGRGRARAARPRGRAGRRRGRPRAAAEGARPDVAFIALHGAGGEDGTVQELLEILGIPYTGPGRRRLRALDGQGRRQARAAAAGVPTPDWVAFNATAFRELGAADALEEIEARLGFPLVVKPARGGSALGVRFAASRADVPEALVAAFSYDDRVMLERHVAGRELAVGAARRRAAADRRGAPAGGGPLQLRGPLRDRAHRVRLPGRARGGDGHRGRRARGCHLEALGCEGFARVD